MKLATLRDGSRDGKLAVVSRDLTRAIHVPEIAETLQYALDHWSQCENPLEAVALELDRGPVPGEFAFDQHEALSPLPRAYQWSEGSVYLVHLERCRAATKRDLPRIFYEEVCMYQGGSAGFLAPHEPVSFPSDEWGIDLEAGICVITDNVPMGTPAAEAAKHIKLVLLTNDVSLRAIQGHEMAKGLGVLQCKPANAFSPVAVTPAGLGKSWSQSMLACPVASHVNGNLIGNPIGNIDYCFDFTHLISHLAMSRDIAAGSIIGAGTVANRDDSRGVSCILEKRALEFLHSGEAQTPFLKFGDRIRIESFDEDGNSIFGAIDQEVQRRTTLTLERVA